MTLPEFNCSQPVSDNAIAGFQAMVWDYYRSWGRSFPWRETRDAFAVYISEVMLQQTQTSRVLPKYYEFLAEYRNFHQLARAELADIIGMWSGLGYNRRAKFLHEAAGIIHSKYADQLPHDPAELQQLPGIGPNTAGSLVAFVYNLPVVFIETNIRRVFLHYFFSGMDRVTDSQLFPFIEQSLDRENPREWYYALMDLGVAVKAVVPNPNRRSRHYSRQSPFENSHRQLRGRILRLLQEHDWINAGEVAEKVEFPLVRVVQAVSDLEQEGFLERRTDGSIGFRRTRST